LATQSCSTPGDRFCLGDADRVCECKGDIPVARVGPGRCRSGRSDSRDSDGPDLGLARRHLDSAIATLEPSSGRGALRLHGP
jgi:hypothetical protein